MFHTGGMTDGLESLVYRSTTVHPFGPDELDDLAFRAQQRNATLAITGYLSHRTDRFTQYLEGPPEAMRTIFAAIEADTRHRIDIQVTLPVETRRFPDWSMKLLNPLWYPSGAALDVIDELLQTPQLDADHQTIRPSLERLLDQVANNERY